MVPRLSPEVSRLFEPFAVLLRDVAKRAVESAADTVLEEVETRAEGVVRSVAGARRKIGKKSKREEDVVVEAVEVSSSRTSRRKKRRR